MRTSGHRCFVIIFRITVCVSLFDYHISNSGTKIFIYFASLKENGFSKLIVYQILLLDF